MKSRGRMIAAVVLGLLFASAAAADTLELRDGRVLHGRYLGGTQAVLRFEIRGEVQTFNVSEAVALTFTGSASSMSAPALRLLHLLGLLHPPQDQVSKRPTHRRSLHLPPPDLLPWRPRQRIRPLSMGKSRFRRVSHCWCA